MYTEKMYCNRCKEEVEAEVYDLDGTVSYCPICGTGYREVSYEAHMRELADEAAVLSEFENETSPKIVRQLTPSAADIATTSSEFCECGTSIEHHTGMNCLYRDAANS